jgi:hypothetical protein
MNGRFAAAFRPVGDAAIGDPWHHFKLRNVKMPRVDVDIDPYGNSRESAVLWWICGCVSSCRGRRPRRPAARQQPNTLQQSRIIPTPGRTGSSVPTKERAGRDEKDAERVGNPLCRLWRHLPRARWRRVSHRHQSVIISAPPRTGELSAQRTEGVLRCRRFADAWDAGDRTRGTERGGQNARGWDEVARDGQDRPLRRRGDWTRPPITRAKSRAMRGCALHALCGECINCSLLFINCRRPCI